jgi:hypothetical protein
MVDCVDNLCRTVLPHSKWRGEEMILKLNSLQRPGKKPLSEKTDEDGAIDSDEASTCERERFGPWLTH